MWSVTWVSVVSLLSLMVARCEGNNNNSNGGGRRFQYPSARRNMSVVDDYHGTKVHDPYRWLEDPDSAETKAFITAQNAISGPFIDTCPVKEQIKEKLTQGRDYPKYGCPMHEGGKYYYFHNTGLQNQDVMYVQDTLDSEPSEFLNPNNFSEDGTVALSYAKGFSKDGSYYAYSVSKGGSDWMTIKVRNVSDGQDLPDTLEFVKFSLVAWTADNGGFFYSRYLTADCVSDGSDIAKNVHHKLYYHHVGTDQSQDVLAFHIPHHPKAAIMAMTSDDGNYLIIDITTGTSTNKVYIADLQSLQHGVTGLLHPEKVVDNYEHAYTYVTHVGQEFIFNTNKDAPFRKLIKINISNPDSDSWETLVRDDPKKGLLVEAFAINNKLVLHYHFEAKSQLYIHNLQTGAREHEAELEIGSVDCMTGKATDTEMFFSFTSFLYSGIIYSLNMTSYSRSVYREDRVNGFVPEDFEMHQVFYTSYDGTRVPMFVVHKKNLELSGHHPVLMYGYGGFDVTLTPFFSMDTIVFIQHLGGVFAMPNIRGGAEYGEDWHQDGMLGNKQNVFDDFQAAAEYLINNNYTNRNKIAIHGASNGGLLVGACLNQRPDLFAAGIASVGVMDMLRFQKFTLGGHWISEYGSSANATQFQWLYRYSPLHNIPCKPRGGQYPATLVLTADKDDRVVPLHSLKFTAELQYTLGNNHDQTNPLLLRVETNAGHGAGKPTSKRIEEKTVIYSFLYNTLNLSWCDI